MYLGTYSIDELENICLTILMFQKFSNLIIHSFECCIVPLFCIYNKTIIVWCCSVALEHNLTGDLCA